MKQTELVPYFNDLPVVCQRCGWVWHPPLFYERCVHYNECAGAYLCDWCEEDHREECPSCMAWHVEDQALLAAYQLGKDWPDMETWSADDEAALCLEDRTRRAYQHWPQAVTA
ncbi:MAG: hypothetical protein ABIH46_08330 [Chloroflexota bacterium]